jgi:hypothetical protein
MLMSSRHVRTHHVDKDKDDPQLRKVLAQTPEGPTPVAPAGPSARGN